MQLFYSNVIHGDVITLPEQESSHCTRVLRMRAGDEIHVTNGKGQFFTGTIEVAHDKKNHRKGIFHSGHCPDALRTSFICGIDQTFRPA